MTSGSTNAQSAGAIAGIGRWRSTGREAEFSADGIARAAGAFRRPTAIVYDPVRRRVGVGLDGHLVTEPGPADGDELACLGVLPPLYPEWLGDRGFCEAHGVRFPYVAGAMARGIASTRLVVEMARSGMLAFFGAAGLAPRDVSAALDTIAREAPEASAWGCNLIHSPQAPDLEQAIVETLLEHGVQRVCASAFTHLTLPIVRYAATGLRRAPSGEPMRMHHLFAKVSHPAVARRFMAPPPAQMLDELVARGQVSVEEAEIARTLPLAEDFTVEADSGGHTDGRPLGALLPAILRTRDEMAAAHRYDRVLRVGAAGGLGTPEAVAAAFAMGAAYVLTGSINQACVEAGVSDEAKAMLADAGIADVALAPAADMFELGARVQVLSRGTLFAARAARLYELFRRHESLEAIPADERERIERQLFHRPLDVVWEETQRYFESVDAREAERARRDPKHRLALVFRWYLGRSSRWPVEGEAARRGDYQIWCGPAMGAFNAWVAGSFLEAPRERGVVQVALNLLEGAATVTRAHQLRGHGAPVPSHAFAFKPRRLSA